MKNPNEMSGTELTRTLADAQLMVEQAGEYQQASALIESLVAGDEKTKSMSMGMLIGRIQMAKSISKITDVIGLEAVQKIKKSKLYKDLKGIKTADGSVFSGTWDDFCLLIGSSRAHMDERLNQLEHFGQEALDAMQSIGLGMRDLRRLRKLPQEELASIVENGELRVADKEEAVAIIEEMAVKHRQEKEELSERISQLEQERAATERLLTEKDKKMNELDKRLQQGQTPAQKKQEEERLNSQLHEDLVKAKIQVMQGFAALEDAISHVYQAPRHPCDLDDACLHTIREVAERFSTTCIGTNTHEQVLNIFQSGMLAPSLPEPAE
jgi:hypothetical protein